ncbi:unnamed protein product [Clavelina lepadiformis]|uniref:Uncharacterized protein n=1 Tax=Clavelina lepadiformis TaxID=159417 RepID=A0ABP0FGF4_CLALP
MSQGSNQRIGSPDSDVNTRSTDETHTPCQQIYGQPQDDINLSSEDSYYATPRCSHSIGNRGNTEVVHDFVEGTGVRPPNQAQGFYDSGSVEYQVSDPQPVDPVRLTLNRPLKDAHINKVLGNAAKAFNSSLMRAANFSSEDKSYVKGFTHEETCRNIIALWKSRQVGPLTVGGLTSWLVESGWDPNGPMIADISYNPP